MSSKNFFESLNLFNEALKIKINDPTALEW